MAVRDGKQTRLFSRNGYDNSRRRARLIGALNAVPATRFVIDGELVVLDGDGRSNFARLTFGPKGTHMSAFGLFAVGQNDLRSYALETRKRVLQELLGQCDAIRYCDRVFGSGKAFFELVRQAGLEGMVAKRRQSSCRGSLTDDWLKVNVCALTISSWAGRFSLLEILTVSGRCCSASSSMMTCHYGLVARALIRRPS